MRQNDSKTLIGKFGEWLEERLKDIELKIDHILFRLKYEDPRVYINNNRNSFQNGKYDDLETEEEFRDI